MRSIPNDVSITRTVKIPRAEKVGVQALACPAAWHILTGTRFTGMPQRFEVAKNRVLLHGAVIEIDDASGNAVKIQRVSEAI